MFSIHFLQCFSWLIVFFAFSKSSLSLSRSLFTVVFQFEWPSLTCQWLPDKVCTPGKDYSTQVAPDTVPLFTHPSQRLLVGTHTTGDEPNYLNFVEVSACLSSLRHRVFQVRIPLEDADVITPTQTVPEAKEGYVGRPGRQVEVVQSIIHQGEVNRARFCPHNPNVVATKAPGVFSCASEADIRL